MGGVHGKPAQEEKARLKAEKREAKEEAKQEEARVATAHIDARERMGKELDHLFKDFLRGLKTAVEAEVNTRTRAMKGQNNILREQVQEAKKLAEDRRKELDAQVRRARGSEQSLAEAHDTISGLRGLLGALEVSEGALKTALAQAKTKAAQDIKKAG